MAEKPHVLIIMADQLRADVLGEYTPHINQLERESVVFDRAYCASPLCVPARGAFFTGKYPNETGSLINPWEKLEKEHGLVRSGTPNLYQWMEQDWDSWHTGKQHFYTEDEIDQSSDTKTHWLSMEKGYRQFLQKHNKRRPGGSAFTGLMPEMAFGKTTRAKRYSIPTTGRYEEGFEYFFDGYIVNTALEALRNRDRNKPMLLNTMFLAPHPPLDIPDPWYSRVKNVTLPDNVGKWCDNQSPLQLYNLTGALGTRYTRDEWHRIWQVYIGLVSLLDDCIGMLIEELKAQGLYDDTLIIFTSDHGEMLGSHCLWQKMCMYEGSTRTPLYMKFPKDYCPAVHRSEELVSAVDVFPTLCDFLGLEIPPGVSGLSLMPVVEGETLERDSIFIQFDGNGARGNFQRCMVQGDYKLIVDLFKDELFIELYDVKHDPQEMVNLAFKAGHANHIEQMLGRLSTYMDQTNDLLEIPVGAYDTFVNQYQPFKK